MYMRPLTAKDHPFEPPATMRHREKQMYSTLSQQATTYRIRRVPPPERQVKRGGAAHQRLQLPPGQEEQGVPWDEGVEPAGDGLDLFG